MIKEYHLHLPKPKMEDPLKKQDIQYVSTSNPQIHLPKKIMHQANHLNPMINSSKPFIAHSKNPQKISVDKGLNKNSNCSSKQLQKSEYGSERVKSNSFATDGGQGQKLFAQKQYTQAQQEKSEIMARERNNQQNKIQKQNQYQNKILQEQNKGLVAQIQKCHKDLNEKNQLISQKNKKIIEFNSEIFLLKRQLENHNDLRRQNNSVMTQNRYLLTKCHNFEQNEQQFFELKDRYLSAMQRCNQLQNILQEKDIFIHNTLQSKADQYNSMLVSKNNSIRALEHRLTILEREQQKLIRELTLKEEIVVAVPKRVEADINKFQKVGLEFQEKINLLLDQNLKLKNSLNLQQGKLEQLQMKNQSLQTTLSAFEDRDKIDGQSRLVQQLENLRSKQQEQQYEHDQLISKYQLQILTLQNVILNRRYEATGSLLDFSDEQKLHQKLFAAIAEIQRLTILQKKR